VTTFTEFMAADTHALADEEGEYSDWIELYNRRGEWVCCRILSFRRARTIVPGAGVILK
jgi:hypothetical protein